MKITPASGSRLITDGRNATWSRYTVTGRFNDSEIEMEIVATAIGASQPVSYSARAPDGKPLEAAQLVAIPWARLHSDAAAAATTWLRYTGPTPDGGSRYDPVPLGDRAAIHRSYSDRRQRGRSNAAPAPWVTARIYLAAQRAGRNEARAIQDALGRSKTQAYLDRDNAIAAGFLDFPSGPARSGAA